MLFVTFFVFLVGFFLFDSSYFLPFCFGFFFFSSKPTAILAKSYTLTQTLPIFFPSISRSAGEDNYKIR